jgi:hypothetical protein
MGRIDPSQHRQRPWRVHALAPDFELLDVWEYPIRARPPHDLAYFAGFFQRVEREVTSGAGAAGLLFKLRAFLGRVFGWDDDTGPLPIPGCEETSLRTRLSPGEDPGPARAGLAFDNGLGFDVVYERDDELLYEISNRTVHALMHLGWIDKGDGTHAPRMAVYVKPRGASGRIYMALIAPFRHLVVYPTLLRKMGAAWEAAHPASA